MVFELNLYELAFEIYGMFCNDTQKTHEIDISAMATYC